MPMMMHHDGQPLITRRSDYGLLNQVRLLRKAGAVSLQVMMLMPSVGSKQYEELHTSGMAFKSVAGSPVQSFMYEGNFVIASKDKRPWQKQFNLILAYLYFYNPVWFGVELFRKRGKLARKPMGMQAIGMAGLLFNIWQTAGWTLKLMLGRIERATEPPPPRVRVRRIPGAAPAAADVHSARAAEQKEVRLPVLVHHVDPAS